MRIAFCGAIGAGKTTAAQYLANRYDVPRVSLAGAVREVAALRHSQPEKSIGDLFAWVDRNLADWPVEKREHLVWLWTEDFFRYWPPDDPKRRRLLVAVGQSGRQVDTDIWINLLLRRIGGGPALVDDLRFLNEAAALRKAGFLVVRLNVPEAERIKRIALRDGAYRPEYDRDTTEGEWARIPADMEIDNGGDIGEFYRQLVERVEARCGVLKWHAV